MNFNIRMGIPEMQELWLDLQEKRVLKYLDLLSNQFLYQKMGFLLSEHKEKMGLSDEFFDTCKSQIGKSKRYLTKDMSGGQYVDEWKLGAICQTGVKT